MPFQLSFTRREKYSSLAKGINLETTLRFGDLFINCDAKVDTGAEVCLFQRAIGEALGIPIENGVKKRLETLTGVLTAYGHEVVLELLGLQLQTVVYFAETGEVRRNFLGRQGWLQLIRLGIVDYDSELHVSLYANDRTAATNPDASLVTRTLSPSITRTITERSDAYAQPTSSG